MKNAILEYFIKDITSVYGERGNEFKSLTFTEWIEEIGVSACVGIVCQTIFDHVNDFSGNFDDVIDYFAFTLGRALTAEEKHEMRAIFNVYLAHA